MTNYSLEDGTYQLGNHPDGNAAQPAYGLRLDGLLTGDADDIVTFDFEHAHSDVRLEINGSQIRIYGVAFGGIDTGSEYDPHNSGLFEIDFTYNNVEGLAGDDDLIVDEANSGTNTGTIKQLYGKEQTFDLTDYAGNFGYSFQLGNEADDHGHRGFDGISGWGWIDHSGADGVYAPASDWLFTVKPQPIQEPNNAPNAIDDSATTTAGQKVGVRVLDNDSDPDGDTLELKSFTQASNGRVVRNHGGTEGDRSDDRLVYIPNDGFTGTDTFTYTIADGNGGHDTAEVTVTVDAANNAPDAVDDSASTTPGQKVGVRVLNNDSDPDGDTLELKSFTQAANGKVVRNNNGTPGDKSDDRLVYTPNDGFTGTDTFTYTIADGNGGHDTAEVTVTVDGGNSGGGGNPGGGGNNNDPVAVDDSASTNLGQKVGVFVLNNDSDSDGDTVTLKSFTQAANGKVVRNNNGTPGDQSDDRLVYTPNDGFTGTDSFTYTIADGNGGHDTAEVTVTVDAPNNAPIAVDDHASTLEGQKVGIRVLENDSDPDGDSIRINFSKTDKISANGGTIRINRNGTPDVFSDDRIVYIPEAGFTGDDTFSYAIVDSNGAHDTATVKVTVEGTTPVNNAPDAVNDHSSTGFETPVSIDVIANDTDADGDNLSVTSINGQAIATSQTVNVDNGTVRLRSNGELSFVPNSGFSGDTTFSYHVSDGNGGEDTANVKVTVGEAPNAAPNAVNDSEVTDLNTPVTINVLENDSDPDGDTLSISSLDNPGNGQVEIVNDQVVYTPNNGFFGNDSFVYHINDGNGGTDTATVEVLVQKVDVDLSVKTDGIGIYQRDKRLLNDLERSVTLRQTITVTNESNETATGVVVATDLQPGLDVWEPDQARTVYGTDWINAATADDDERLLTDPATVDPTNGNVIVNDVPLANGGISNSNNIAPGQLTWELGTPLAPGESATLTFYAQRSSELARTRVDFDHTASLVSVDQHDTNSANNSDSFHLLYTSPIAFDLNGDGVQTLGVNQGVQFDMLATGYTVQTGWLSGEDGFLATDDNGNGIIDDRSELFGGGVGEGFAELASFDSNGDSVVNELDDRFSELLVWQDANENGLTDSGELISLADAGITNIATDYVDIFRTDAQGNIHGEHSSAQLNGNTIDVVDVYFQVEV